MRVFLCFRVFVFLHNTSKSFRSRNTKLEYTVVYENISDKFEIGPDQGQGHGTALKFFSIYRNTNYYVPYLNLRARKLILSVYVYLIILTSFINIVTLE